MKIETIKECDLIIEELKLFSDSILDLGKPVNDDRLEEFEKNIGYKLPSDFKYILKKFNSFSLAGTQVYGLEGNLFDTSLDNIYLFETSKTINPIYKEYLPFSPDGRGNHYCLNLSRLNEELCPVLFWQHDFIYADESQIEICNDNFLDWIREVIIAWTLESYDYDGSKK